jgi:hypothetical protein
VACCKALARNLICSCSTLFFYILCGASDPSTKQRQKKVKFEEACEKREIRERNPDSLFMYGLPGGYLFGIQYHPARTDRLGVQWFGQYDKDFAERN